MTNDPKCTTGQTNRTTAQITSSFTILRSLWRAGMRESIVLSQNGRPYGTRHYHTNNVYVHFL